MLPETSAAPSKDKHRAPAPMQLVAIGAAALIVVVGVGAGPAHPDQADGAVPRYQLEVGQELVYRLTRHQDFDQGDSADVRSSQASDEKPRDQMEWRVIVADQNYDGSWRLLIRTKIAFCYDDGSVRARRESLGDCDLQPDGSYQIDEQKAIAKRLLPYELFCRTPGSETELNRGWESRYSLDARVHKFAVTGREGPRWQIVASENTVYSGAHGWEFSRRYDFDASRGLVTSIAHEWRDAGASQVKDRRIVEIVSVEKHDADWMRRFRRESERYLQDNSKWLALCYAAMRAPTPEACRQSRAEAKSVLAAGRDEATLPLVVESYDSDLRQHNDDEQWATETVDQRMKFFAAAPSFADDWETTDLNDRPFRLADHRGRPLALFFWGTNCEYCVMMGAQLNRLAPELERQGALIVGMFVYRDDVPRAQELKQARYLIDRAYQGFTHVDGTDVEKQYRLAEFGLGHPTLIMLDRSGKPYEVQSGYTADLTPRMHKTMSELLEPVSKPGASPPRPINSEGTR